MKYTKEQRIDIGRQVYTHEISRIDAQIKYGIAASGIDKYVHAYKVANGIPTQTHSQSGMRQIPGGGINIETYRAMSKEELIDELIKAKVNEARAKKGYEVKGVGAGKEYISLNNRNSKS